MAPVHAVEACDVSPALTEQGLECVSRTRATALQCRAMARRHAALVPLSHDHQRALSLAFRLHHPAPPGPVTPTTPASTPASRRAETLAFFRDHLLRHFAIEEDVLFPVLRSAYGPGTQECGVIDALCAEHRRMTEVRDAIAEAAAEDELCRALTQFADLLELHVRREERELFARFPGALGPDAVGDLHREIHARRPPDAPGACKV
jgi:hemerythrin-like domain-containing protein